MCSPTLWSVWRGLLTSEMEESILDVGDFLCLDFHHNSWINKVLFFLPNLFYNEIILCFTTHTSLMLTKSLFSMKIFSSLQFYRILDSTTKVMNRYNFYLNKICFPFTMAIKSKYQKSCFSLSLMFYHNIILWLTTRIISERNPCMLFSYANGITFCKSEWTKSFKKKLYVLYVIQQWLSKTSFINLPLF